jgi:tetratricopeptide (TPR) repeat protein
MSPDQPNRRPDHQVVLAPHRRDRAAGIAELSSLALVTAPISAHRRLGGPYTATGQLMRALAPEALRRWPELVHAHQIELLCVSPELRELIPATIETLTSLSIPNERTRFYSRMRTLRLAHGLVEFVSEHLRRLGGGPRRLFIDEVHEADPTDQEFLAVLLRRIDPELLNVVLGCSPEFFELSDDRPGPEVITPLAGGLPAALRRHCQPIRTEPAAAQDLNTEDDLTLARRFVAGDGVDDDPQVLAACSRLDPRQLVELHDARADELEAVGDRSSAYGAIPYHRERGAQPREVVLRALFEAMEHGMLMGFYDSCIDMCHRGRALLDPEVDSVGDTDLWWTFTAKLPTALSILGRGEEAELLCEKTRAESRNPLLHIQFAYASAMLYTRHLQTERRDDERALGWINIAIAISSLVPDPKQRVFHSVFNHNGLALIEAHRGRPLRALELVTKGLAELDQQLEPGEHQLHRSVLRYNRAQVLAGLGRVEEALQEYRTVLESDPNYPEYHFDIGNLLRRLGRDDEALAEYETTMTLSPPFPEVFYNRADIYAAAGDLDAALKDFDYVLELNPEHVDALLNRAGILADLERPAEASRDVEAGLALEPRNPHLLSLRARLALESDDLATARAVISDALAVDPAMPQAWALSGAIEFEAGDFEAAIDNLTRAAELAPDADVLFNRGSVRQAAGQWALAIEDFDAVLALAPAEAQAWLRRAQCRAALGDHAGAAVDAARSMALEPDLAAEAAELRSDAVPVSG